MGKAQTKAQTKTNTNKKTPRGFKIVTVMVHEELWKQSKVVAAETGYSLQELVAQGLVNVIREQGFQPPALTQPKRRHA